MAMKGYIGMVQEVRPILARMEERGLPIDDAARLRLDAEFEIAQRDLLAQIVAAAPPECCRVHPKEGYKGTPPEVKQWERDNGVVGADSIISGDDGEHYRYQMRQFDVPTESAGELTTIPTLRWCRVYDFNPNSSQQVKDYIRAKGHKMPKSRQEDDDGKRKDTTAEKELRRLAASTGDLFYISVVEYRGLTKLRSTYVDGFKPGADGCVHTTFTFDTAIGQLSSRNPNTQNFPKLKPTKRLAEAMRAMVAAKPGNILVEWDYKSCHVLTLGFLAEDPTWMRLARLDMHSFTAGHVLGLWDGPSILRETDAELMARFKWLKSDPDRKRVRDDQAKHGILGIGNGLSAKGLYERYIENFPPQRCDGCKGSGRVQGARTATKKCPECGGLGMLSGLRVAQTFLSALHHLAPAIFAYQRREREAAHARGTRGVISPFGMIRRFYEVYVFDRRWDPGTGEEPPRGDQAEQAVSFRHMNVAHCHLRVAMKDLARLGLDEKYGMCNTVHDSLFFHFPEAMLDEHVREIQPVMEAPSTVLRNAIAPDGLVINVEASWGHNWAEMTEIKLPRLEIPATPALPPLPNMSAVPVA